MKSVAFVTILFSSILSATTLATEVSISSSSMPKDECVNNTDRSLCLGQSIGAECRGLVPGLFSISHIVRKPNNEFRSAEFYKKLIWDGVVVEEKTHALESAFEVAIYTEGYRYYAFGEKTNYTEKKSPFEESEFQQGVCRERFTGMVYHYR